MIGQTTQAYYITTNGCRGRQLEASKIGAFFDSNGLKRTEVISEAQIVVFASCAFSDLFEEKAREILERIRANSAPGTKLVITGCYPKIVACGGTPTGFTYIDADDEPERISALVDSPIVSFRSQRQCRISVLNEVFPSEYAVNEYFVRISKGCLNNCSYCIIKRAQGNLKSRNLEDIKAEVLAILDKTTDKVKISFIGEDVGAFGRDHASNFDAFASFILSLKGDFIIGLDHSGPQWFLKDYQAYELFAGTGRLHNILLGIQSGSSEVLKQMRRPYDIDTVTRYLTDFSAKYPDVLRAIHLIVGFPGEKDRDFQQTLEFVERTKPNSIGVFSFSPRQGTDAALMPQLAKTVIAERVCALKVTMEKLDIKGYFH